MLPVGLLVIIIFEGGADSTNQKVAASTTILINRIVLKAATRPSPKVSVKRVSTRRGPMFSVIRAGNMIRARRKNNFSGQGVASDLAEPCLLTASPFRSRSFEHISVSTRAL